MIFIAAAIALFVALSVLLDRRARARVRARLRGTWGERCDRARNMEAIAGYHRSRAAAGPAGAWLDDRTWEDLDLDSVFALIDRTESTLGQQSLYHRLRTAPAADHLDAFESLVGRLTDDLDAREGVQMVLVPLQDPAGYDVWWLARAGGVERRTWHAVFPAIALVMLSSLLIAPFWRPAVAIAAAGAAINLAVRVVTARRVGSIVGSFRQLGPVIAAAEALRFLDDGDAAPIVGCLRTDTPQLRRLKTIARWVSRNSSSQGDLAGTLLEYINVLFLLDVNALYFGAHELEVHGESLLRVIGAVGDVDAALSIASYRFGTRSWTRPDFRPPGAPMMLADVRHPLLESAVPNSVRLAPPHGLLVTGSNMSGKSTFVRTVGVNTVLAQTVGTCTAAAYDAPILTVRTCIGRSDDLLAGKSYYIVEAESVLALVRASASGAPHLFLFDELFRGTNAVERIAAAEAVLVELLEPESASAGFAAAPARAARGVKPHVVIAATHDAELVDLLAGRYAACHFEDTLGPEGLVFEYKLTAGPATTRNAIELLRLMDAPERLVGRALALAATLDAQRHVVAREPS